MYTPKPVDTGNIELSDDLMALAETLAVGCAPVPATFCVNVITSLATVTVNTFVTATLALRAAARPAAIFASVSSAALTAG